jgi:hypothetical protein
MPVGPPFVNRGAVLVAVLVAAAAPASARADDCTPTLVP